jgi:hypothetical protein
MNKKSLSKKLVDAIDAGAQALLGETPAKPLAEMPETPLLVLPEGKKATATASLRRADAEDT